MTQSCLYSSQASLMREVSGRPLEGFAKDFVRESIKATLKYPQTQAVIRLAVAGAILDASLRGAEREIVDLYTDLQASRTTSVDLERISRFVHQHYRNLKLPIPEFPIESYARLFTYEIEAGFRAIASAYLFDQRSRTPVSSLLEELGERQRAFDIRAWCDSLREVEYERRSDIRRALGTAVKDLYRDPRQKAMHDFLIHGLRTEPRERWGMFVTFPYVATVTKMGMSAERRCLEELRMPPRPECHYSEGDLSVNKETP